MQIIDCIRRKSMRKFDYSFLKRSSVPADIVNSATSIFEMKARAEMRQVDFSDVFSAMESVAKIQSVKAPMPLRESSRPTNA